MPSPPTPQSPTLYLIDGYAQFFRSYHAIRTPMTSPVTKEPTNMTFGFVGMLLKLLKADGPNLRAHPATHVAVVLDVSGDRGTFRSQLYPQYKATRKPPPEDLEPQVQRCLAMLREVGVPCLGSEGFEADDVLATLVSRLRTQHPGLRVRLVSKDKDLKQLLSPAGDAPAPVELFDVHTDTPFDAAALHEQTGLAPAQVIDMLAVMGDSSDNVPGVDGVGEKTAAQLISEHGSLDALLAKADQIKGKRGENIRAAREQLQLSRTLVTLRHDAPVDFDLASARVDALHLDRLIPICKELGFHRYQDEVRALLGTSAGLPSAGAAPSTASAPSPTSAARAAQPSRRAPSDAQQGGLFDELAARATADASPAIEPLAPEATLRPATAQGTYQCVRTSEQLEQLLERCARAEVVSVDTETTSLSPRDARLCGISIAIREHEAFYIPTLSPTPQAHLDTGAVLRAMRPMLEDPRLPKCGHNLKYDLLIFRAQGISLRGVRAEGGPCGFDSMVASYLLDASRSSHALEPVALALLGQTKASVSELIGTGKQQRTFDTVPLDLATEYAARDADLALRLRNTMLPQLRERELLPLFEGTEMPLVEVLAELEWNGVRVDRGELERQRSRLQGQIDALRKRIEQIALHSSIARSFDPDSPKQLAEALFNPPTDDRPGLGLKGTKRTKTGLSTDAEVLEALAEDEDRNTAIPALVLEYRQLSKLVSTYLVALQEAIHPATGRIHASFHQTVAATGRLSSSDPNLQNIPIRTDVGREVRKAFIADEGNVLVTADYSQIELRLLAHLSQDPGLIDAFEHEVDIHTAVAAQIAGKEPKDVTRDERAGAKMVNFGIVYGITAFGLARRLKIDTARADQIITSYKKRFAGITTFLQECVQQARDHGFVVTMLGRRRPIPDIDSTNPSRRALAERLAINSVVQGSAADLIKVAMVNIESRLRDARHAAQPLGGVRMILQVHDELVLEAPLAQADGTRALVVHEMEHAMQLRVPLRADAHVGRDWYEGKH